MLGFVAISHLCGVLSNRLRLAERYEQLRTPTLWDDHTPLTRAAVAGAGAEVMFIMASGPVCGSSADSRSRSARPLRGR
jgi:hypothetical protein